MPSLPDSDLELAMASNETTPLLESDQTPVESDIGASSSSSSSSLSSRRQKVFDFLEAKTYAGAIYERFMILLIVANVLAFILSTLFVEDYNIDAGAWASRTSDHGICGTLCDTLWFGNHADNGLAWLHLGSTSVLELGTVAVFTVEYVLRFWTADLEDAKYRGWSGRLLFLPSFFSLVDLASTLPFYIDALLLRHSDLAASSFLRMFRLLRMMRVEGRYDTALTMVDDVLAQQAGILGVAFFVGVTTWIAVAATYYLVERRNTDMIYCPACPDVETADCVIDYWGAATCPGCPDNDAVDVAACYNLFQSIPSASYYALINLFGEYPLIDQHSSMGQVVGTITAVVAVAVFALPAGIIGNGFEDVIAAKLPEDADGSTNRAIVEQGGMTTGFSARGLTTRAKIYNLLNSSTDPVALALDRFINLLIGATALTFMVDTLGFLSPMWHILLDSFELVSVSIFTIEYMLRLYSAKEDPKYSGPGGRFLYMTTFLSVVDLVSFVPYWIEVAITGHLITPVSDSSSTYSNIVKSLRLLRILRFERYTHAFTSFDDVIARNVDILAVTMFTAVLLWIFFSAFLYFTERDNLDPEMAENYKTVPDAMWMTLLNLSGEAPLAQYSLWGKFATGFLGIFATGIFGIPIGVLGAGFEQVVEEENEDNEDELRRGVPRSGVSTELGSPLERAVFNFVNGNGSKLAEQFEMLTYSIIFFAVFVGVWQTVEGQENAYSNMELVAVIFFTFEYLMRLVGAGADPEFAPGRGAISCRLAFVVSFYSIIDLLAIVPYYLALALPNSVVNEYDEYLRMLRILRLLKLDKYIPSITLIDDVIRLKANTLRVAGFAAATLWVLFSALLFLCEHNDLSDKIDNLPQYGCDSDCAMKDRFQNFFDSLVYTGIHLTGDYPITEYSWPAKFVNFFMVVAAVGVVSIPSGLIASGFVQIVQSKNKAKRGEPIAPAGARAGDDWYEVQYRALAGTEPPPSRFGPTVDKWQTAVNDFLNGVKHGEHHTWSGAAKVARVFIIVVILSNVAAVLAESVPWIDKAVGNEPGNFFDRFEFFSVMVFAVEYILRLFCAPKSREALYSTFVYATTFFGIVDFLSTAPWFFEQALLATGQLDASSDSAKIFRIFRIFRILQLEDFVTAFSKLDNVFRASKDVLKATGLMALIIWVTCGALFYIFEGNNPNWRVCDDQIPLHSDDMSKPGCYDFVSTAGCNEFYPGLCEQKAFVDMPNALYYTAVFLGGEWGLVDFTWPGRLVCLFLCVVGIALYAIPIGTLFDSFGAVLGMGGDDDDEEEEEHED